MADSSSPNSPATPPSRTNRPMSEALLNEKWDHCLSTLLIRTTLGASFGVIFSVLLFKRRAWPVWTGLGFGAGRAWEECDSSTYIALSAVQGGLSDSEYFNNILTRSSTSDMAAIFDRSNPASPLAYTASQTALLLLDFQNFIIDRCGPEGLAALATGKVMRDWAFKHNVMVIHSVVDVNEKPPSTSKRAERTTKMLQEIANDKDAAKEPREIAFAEGEREYLVLKFPGFVSGLKSAGAQELLKEHGIKSLILCGLSTSGAVLRTAMPATDDGFIVSVIEDACTDPVDGLHETLMKTVLPSRAHVATAEEFMKVWKDSDM